MTATTGSLNVQVDVRDRETAVVAVGGELDLDTATQLHHHLANQMVHGRRHLVIELSDLSFMDSSGLNILIRATRETRKAGGSLHLVAPAPAVARLLDITGLTATSHVHEDVAAALASLPPERAGS